MARFITIFKRFHIILQTMTLHWKVCAMNIVLTLTYEALSVFVLKLPVEIRKIQIDANHRHLLYNGIYNKLIINSRIEVLYLC